MRKSTTIFINNDTSNPISVDVVIVGEKHALNVWDWAIEKVTRVGLVIGDKEEIDITNKVLSSPRALALIKAQAASEDDQIIDALEAKPEPEPIEN
jgi:hypothetical protein